MNQNDLTESEIEEKVVHIMRDLGIGPVWSNGNFYDYLKKLYALNQSLPESDRVHHYFSDVPFNWEGMTEAKYDSFWRNVVVKRDEIMADRIEAKFKEILNSDASRKKCLVIMNYWHAFGPIRDSYGNLQGNTAEYLFEAFPEKTANVLINTVGYDLKQKPVSIQDGKWDAAFKVMGDSAVGFHFADSPFGEDPFDMFPFWSWIEEKYKYQDVFTGFIFYQPLERHVFAEGFPGLFDEEFAEEFLARARCFGEDNYQRMVDDLAEYRITRRENVYGDACSAAIDQWLIHTDVLDEGGAAPFSFALEQNYPNPFNATTQIRFTLPGSAVVHLTVYDVLGREVKALHSGPYPAGSFSTTWDGTNHRGAQMASGVYFYRMEAEADGQRLEQTRRMIMIK
jgi:hypothetical protein